MEQLEIVPVAIDDQNDLLSVIVFCYENLFDWLTIEDLAALNNTCKQLQRLTSDYYKRKYNGMVRVINDKYEEIRYLPSAKHVQRFGPDHRNIIIEPTSYNLKYLETSHCNQLDTIVFWHGKFSERDIEIIPKVVEKTKIIKYLNSKFDGEFYESVLKYCKNMKYLVIKHKLTECLLNGEKDKWQLQSYPSLEHFYWDGLKLPNNLETFFQNNPNIRSFQIGNFVFNDTLELLMRTDLRLDELYLEIFNFNMIEHLYEFISMMNTLYERKVFKGLMINFQKLPNSDTIEWSRLTFLNGIFCEMNSDFEKNIIEIINPRLLILKTTRISVFRDMKELMRRRMEELSIKLTNLNELYVGINSIDQIIPFLKNSRNLQKIYVYKLDKNVGFTQLSSLNDERLKLKDAKKVEIFLPDNKYVQLKLISKKINFSMIKIQRIESHNVNHPFVYNTLQGIIDMDPKYRYKLKN